MARGWESKAVADQIEEGDALRAPRTTETSRRSPEEADRLKSLQLSRSRLLQQLENAKHPAHRSVLQKGLQAVEVELEQLNKPL